MLTTSDLNGRSFHFGTADGVTYGRMLLAVGGRIEGYSTRNEVSWDVVAGRLVLRDAEGGISTDFTEVSHMPELVLRGRFLPAGDAIHHVLIETVRRPGGGILDVIRPTFWLEVGSMIGGSAILTAERIVAKEMPTEILCLDPFVGDVNMWAWERGLAATGGWRFLGLDRGRPTIFDRFLANVVQAGQQDRILPVQTTSIVGMRLIERLHREQRLSQMPTVIYLDSAHEAGETRLELERAWELLPPGGVIFGDDWTWSAVRRDVLSFACAIVTNAETNMRLREAGPDFDEIEGVLHYDGQWVLAR